jgi:hypothetical protein
MSKHPKDTSDDTRAFPYAGVTIFVLFFGASLVDAISGAQWGRALFWLGMGVLFLLLDTARSRR